MNSIEEVLNGTAQYAVVCGDCLDVLRTLPDKCGVVITDVPYNVKKPIANDNQPWDEYLAWLDARTVECCRVGRLFFTFFAKTKLIRFIRESTNPPQFEVNWHKSMMLHDTSLNGSPFLAHSESILYWGPMSPKEAGKLGYDSFACNALWPSERRELAIDHPTPKPPELLERVIPHWSREDEIVIDPWCGSGVHLRAALKAGRRAIGIDVDPQWVQHAIEHIGADMAHTTLADVRRGQGGLFV